MNDGGVNDDELNTDEGTRTESATRCEVRIPEVGQSARPRTRSGRFRALRSRATSSPVFRNMTWLFGERVFVTLVGGAATIVVVRYLGPQRFGTYSLALSIVVLAGAFSQLNASLFVRELVNAPEGEAIILGSAAGLSALMVGVAEVALAVIIFTVVPSSETTTRMLIAVFACGLIFAPALVADFAFQARLQAKRATVARNVGLLVASAAALIVVLTDSGVVAMAATTLLAPAVTAVVYGRFYAGIGVGMSRWRPAADVLRRLGRQAIPLTVSSIAIVLYMRIDQVMLGWLSNRTQVGIYAATVRLSEFVYFIPIIFTASIGPGVAALRATDLDAYRERLSRMFVVLSTTSLVIIAATELIGGRVAVLLFGHAYAPVGNVLRIHILASLFVAFGVGEMLYVVNESLQRPFMWKTWAGAVVNVGLNLALLPRFGAVGAAWATLIAYAVAATIGDLVHPRTRPLFVMEIQSLSPVRMFRELRRGLAGGIL